MKLFVYGTLKRGGRLHYRLADNMAVPDVSTPVFLAEDQLAHVTLLDSDFGYPIAVEARNRFITGEVWDIDERLAEHLDDLERGYERRRVTTRAGHEVWVYLWPADRMDVVASLRPLGSTFNARRPIPR